MEPKAKRVRTHPVPATKEKMNLEHWRTGLHVRCGNTQHLPNTALPLNLSTGNRDLEFVENVECIILRNQNHMPDSVLTHPHTC